MVALAAMTPRAQQPQPQAFRGAVDLIAVVAIVRVNVDGGVGAGSIGQDHIRRLSHSLSNHVSPPRQAWFMP